jgi:arginyl-tRNA synthetase
MVAWKLHGNGETPDSINLKGDHLVGKYYVLFDKIYNEEIQYLIDNGVSEKEAKVKAPILIEAKKMLISWENEDSEVRALWREMNGWVYEGFEKTYRNLGVNFDKLYYESDTYQLGKEVVKTGDKKNIFYSKEDGSIWCELSEDKIDDKLLVRSDGTSVYMTQDIGTAVQRYLDYPKLSGIIYTVGNEQNHHFKVLFRILEKLNYSWSSKCFHLSYGMVDLPDGKMKSREGTVVDADELLNSVINEAKNLTSDRGFLEGLSKEEITDICKKIGISGLKYFLLKVDPKKKMSFNPKETIDLSGHTGPFIQYTFVRIKSLLNKSENLNHEFDIDQLDINSKELDVLKQIAKFPEVLEQSATELSPYILANYLYSLVKSYNSFYQDYPIITEPEENSKNFRIQLSNMTLNLIKKGMRILGIEMPLRM